MAGTYSGTSNCSDSDDQVTITTDGSTLTLSGFAGNSDITLTLSNNNMTATATGVTAFSVGGHTLVLTQDSTTGNIQMVLSVAGNCSTTLVAVSP